MTSEAVPQINVGEGDSDGIAKRTLGNVMACESMRICGTLTRLSGEVQAVYALSNAA